MFKRIAIALLFISQSQFSAAAEPKRPSINSLINLCEDFRSLNVRYAMDSGTGISEAQYNEVLDKIQTMLASDVAAHNAHLTINRKWSSATVNSTANQMFGYWWITMDGGLARAPGMNRDAFALVACHEMGHHLGGQPRQLISAGGISSEGEADYYATLKCLRRFFAGEDNSTIVAAENVDPFVASECANEFPRANDQLVCERSAMAGLTIDHILQKVNHDSSVIAFNTPDPHDPILVSTQSHPKAQCRLDTFFNGARCPVDAMTPLSDKSPYPGSCDQEGEPANTGSRPRCWFKP